MVSRWTHRRRRRRRRSDLDLREAIWAVVRRQIPPAQLRLIRLRQRWPELAGPMLAKRAYPADLHGGTLVVHVENDQWRHEFEYLKPALLVRLGEADRGLHTIQVRRGSVFDASAAPTLDRFEHGANDRDAARPPWSGLSADPPAETFDTLMTVRDPQLRHRLAETRMLLAQASTPSPTADDDDATR